MSLLGALSPDLSSSTARLPHISCRAVSSEPARSRLHGEFSGGAHHQFFFVVHFEIPVAVELARHRETRAMRLAAGTRDSDMPQVGRPHMRDTSPGPIPRYPRRTTHPADDDKASIPSISPPSSSLPFDILVVEARACCSQYIEASRADLPPLRKKTRPADGRDASWLPLRHLLSYTAPARPSAAPSRITRSSFVRRGRGGSAQCARRFLTATALAITQ